jgi:hypothetical protein
MECGASSQWPMKSTVNTDVEHSREKQEERLYASSLKSSSEENESAPRERKSLTQQECSLAQETTDPRPEESRDTSASEQIFGICKEIFGAGASMDLDNLR